VVPASLAVMKRTTRMNCAQFQPIKQINKGLPFCSFEVCWASSRTSYLDTLYDLGNVY
jgi:hypothetical protein